MIARKLDYGEEPDSYDPNLTEHPLVNKEIIESFFKCTYDKWKDLKQSKYLNDKINKSVEYIVEDVYKI